jgi:hypothetical protein
VTKRYKVATGRKKTHNKEFYSCMHTYINTDIHTHTYIPWIHKLVMATVGCGICLKDTKQTDKCSNKKTKTTWNQNDKMTDKYFFKIL